MSQNDENPSMEEPEVSEEPRPEAQEKSAETAEAPEPVASSESVKEGDTAPDTADTERVEVEDDLFLDPDEEGGEEIDDVPDLSQVQAELTRANERADALQADLDAMTAERDDFKARLLRSAADLENFRKRKEREREELRKYGADKVVGDLLPAIDNLERALEHAEKSEEQSSIADGVKMVHRQLISALEKHGIKGFTSVGEKFDPQLHEAIQQVETTEFETGVVMQEFQKGYYIHDRLLRPSMTVVAKNVAPVVEVVQEEEITEQEPATEQMHQDKLEQGDEDVIDMGGLEEGSEAGA